MRKILTFIFIVILIPVTSAFSGDSTSLAPQSAPQGSDYYTQGGDIYTAGGHVYTQGGHHYAGGGDVRDVDQLFANRVYARGGGSWINYYDHAQMNNRVIYGAARVRVNDYSPNTYNELASKWYVDKIAKPQFFSVYTETGGHTRNANRTCNGYSNSSRKCYFGSGMDNDDGSEYINCMCWPR